MQLRDLTDRYEREMREKNEKILSLNALVNDQLDTSQQASKSVQDQLAQREKDLAETTQVLSKRDREIQALKQEGLALQEQIRVLRKDKEELAQQVAMLADKENEQSQRSLLQRIKELTCTTLNLRDSETWENSLARVLNASTYEHINFMSAFEGVRVLFMPHSPGVYIALVLKSVEDIEQDALKNKDGNLLD